MNTNGFIRVPNSVVGSLKGYRCVLYIYLLYLCTVRKTNRVTVKLETCRRHIGAAFTTAVCKQMHALEKAGYVKIENNYSTFGLQTCNTVTVNNFNPQKDYFLLPAEHISLKMLPSAFELMLALYMFAFQDPFCYPSFQQIKKVCRLGGSSIVQGYKLLEEKGVIAKENYLRRDGSKGHNRYFLIRRIEKLVGEDKAVRFLAWIRRQKEICYEAWQLIKEVLSGNIGILDEICAEAEREDVTYFYECRDFHSGNIEDAMDHSSNVGVKCNGKRGVLGFVKEKIGRIWKEAGLIVDRIFQKFKRVVL